MARAETLRSCITRAAVARKVDLSQPKVALVVPTRVPGDSSEALGELSAAGDVVMCQLTRYEGTKTIEAWQCRVSGFVPAPAPGRKPKAA
jgi:hypothetical protein